MARQISWRIGGQQGEGIESAGELLALGLAGTGFHLYGYRVFSSRIRGGHTDYSLRISAVPIASVADAADLLVAFDQETIVLCGPETQAGGWILADERISPVAPSGVAARLLKVPLTQLAARAGGERMKNVVALGVSVALMGLKTQAWEEPLRETFQEKGGAILQANRAAFESGWDFGRSLPAELREALAVSGGDGVRRPYVTGNEAIAQGAVAAGARIMAAYPITPASEIMESMVQRLPELGGRMVQTEDEIAACMMAIGANYAGTRAFTATSGPGLSLMSESIGLAAMTETPLVVIDVQRGGPSTGLPTKHEQSDILAALFSTHGEAPKIVLAPDSIAAAYHDTIEAFNLAEEFQCPVILLSDMQISLGNQTVDQAADSGPPIRRGRIAKEAELPELKKNQYFSRYQLTQDGISLRTIPGMRNGIHHTTGLEHDETGRPFEGIGNRTAQMDKRLRKLSAVAQRFPRPVRADAPFEQADLLILGMGGASGAIAEAAAELRGSGLAVNHAMIRLLHPLPGAELRQLLKTANKVVVAEHNATGQLAFLLRAACLPACPVHSVLKYDGTPFRPAEIVAGCREVL